VAIVILAVSIPFLLYASAVASLLLMRAAWTMVDQPLVVGPLASGPQSTIVYDRDGRPVFSFSSEQRIDVPLEDVSPHLVSAILAVEDRRFFSHQGLDLIRIAAAAVRNVQAGRIVQGASTITQQLVRNLYLGPQRTWRRKIREALIATDIEARLSKRQILELYLNTVYFGDGLYGVEATSRGYFGKRAKDLDPSEAALLAGLVRNPSQSPTRQPARALARRNLVLAIMRDTGALAEAEFRIAAAQPLQVRRAEHAGALFAHAQGACGMYFFEEVRRQLVHLFGEDQVLAGGLRVHTTLDVDQQAAAEDAIAARIEKLGAKRALLRRELQGALVSIDPKTGEVLALVGGRDFHKSSFNRATQARRQPGSAFKPIVFAAALERGYGPGSLLRDLETPILAAEGEWLPNGDHEAPQYTLRRALKVSSNRAAAQLLQQVGVLPVIDYARRLGIASELPAVPSLALGTGGVTLLELVSAYAPFANGGLSVRPTMIRRVEDRSGQVLWESPHNVRQAVSGSTAFLMSSMLRDVIAGGTGYLARSMGFRRPAAGKTGTTDDFADAWFVGYTPRLLAGVWFGFDRPRKIFEGGFGGTVAVPAWTTFMLAATKDDPVDDDWYKMPSDVERLTICRSSGELAGEQCIRAAALAGRSPQTGMMPASIPVDPLAPSVGVYEDLFALGTGPTTVCPLEHLEGYLGY
jgi:penicillin-binding protein 1A